ncbi:MAG: polysaccharide deacetylase family protein [Thermomicrobium sp.]|nr:polysaccharide deacetylase family protein [Thermomicrobium sp.]MDW8060059.1 polysaccharide deacetylase family protein [Thermomicrobium sp.]
MTPTPSPEPYLGPVPILMYHYIRPLPGPDDPVGQRLSVDPRDFADQMHWLATHGFTPITLSELVAIRQGSMPAPAKPIVLTFDDGYRDFYENAWPILRKYGFHATIFVITGFLDSPRYLTWDMVRELDRSETVEIGGHTVHHLDLTQLSDEELAAELATCAQDLERALGHPVSSFAYPAGRYDRRVEAATSRAGYRVAVTTQPGWATAGDDPLALPRIRIEGGITLDRFASLLGSVP